MALEGVELHMSAQERERVVIVRALDTGHQTEGLSVAEVAHLD